MQGNPDHRQKTVHDDPDREAAFRFWQRRLLPGIAMDARQGWAPAPEELATDVARLTWRHLVDAGLPQAWATEAVLATRLDRDRWAA